MKLSRFSDIRLVKQKKVSASACSAGRTTAASAEPLRVSSRTSMRSGSFRTFPLAAGVGGEGVVDGAHDLVHALDVGDPRVELGVDEEDPLHHLPVSLAAVRENLVLVGRIQVQSFTWRTDLEQENRVRRWRGTLWVWMKEDG